MVKNASSHCFTIKLICMHFPLHLSIQGELQHQEQTMASSRKERDKVLSEYRAKANERKEFQEKVERRVSK